MAAQLLLNEKGWFLNKDKVVHSGEGPVYAIAWAESLIAWANDLGVKIFDNASGQRITFIDRPKGSARADLMRCNLCWETPRLLLIGWADYLKIAQVKERPARDGLAPVKYVEIVAFFHTVRRQRPSRHCSLRHESSSLYNLPLLGRVLKTE